MSSVLSVAQTTDIGNQAPTDATHSSVPDARWNGDYCPFLINTCGHAYHHHNPVIRKEAGVQIEGQYCDGCQTYCRIATHRNEEDAGMQLVDELRDGFWRDGYSCV